MKKISMAFACTLVFVVAAFATPRYMPVTGGGIDTESDQASAHQNADSQAQSNLEGACAGGSLEGVRKVYDICNQAGDNYLCTVNYVGICKIGN